MKATLTAVMYGTKIAAFDKASGRVILASVVDHTESFAKWQIKAIEQDRMAPAAMIASLEAIAAKDGSRQIEV